MRVLTVLPALALAACASSSAAPAASSTTATIRGGGAIGGSLTMAQTNAPNVSSVSFPMDQVWKVLPAAFDSLAVPLGIIDPVKHIIGNEGFKIRQRLGKVALSRYVECGTTQIGPNADSYEVFMTVLTQLVPGPSGTTSVATTFEALARPITFAQDYSRCTSKGLLETRLMDAVKAQLKG
jgi:hypothetical protein